MDFGTNFSSNIFNLHRQIFEMALDIVGFGYAAIVAIGGIIGYVKAGEYLPHIINVSS